MYELKQNVIELIMTTKGLKRQVANVMGNDTPAIYNSIKKTNGTSIACNYDALMLLSKVTGLKINEIRTEKKDAEINVL